LKILVDEEENRMATYVTSDLHGEYDRFIRLLDEIDLKEEDTLFVLGDVIDRGPHPIKLLQKLMTMPNVICLVGNHELM
jgi:serine/threonine protein phosphatase 1